MATWFNHNWVKIGSLLGAVTFVCILGAVLAGLTLGFFGRRGLELRGSRFDGPGQLAVFPAEIGRLGPEAMGPDRFVAPPFLGIDPYAEFGRPGLAIPHFFRADARGGKGLTGEVTGVEEAGFRLETPSGDNLTINVTGETRIWLIESETEGSLDDLAAGSTVVVLGRESDETVEARGIVVMPAGERGGGRVTAIDGSKITVEDLNGEATIVTTADTQFRLGRAGGSLSDVSQGEFLLAFGDKQEDGPLTARLVFIGRRGAGLWF
jgi:hypothetical protein